MVLSEEGGESEIAPEPVPRLGANQGLKFLQIFLEIGHKFCPKVLVKR
jgi:hypothetical protein